MGVQNQNNNNNEQQRAIRDYFKPPIQEHYSGIRRQTINAKNLELKPSLISMVQQNQFGGLPNEDPNTHLSMFLEAADTVKINGVTEGTIKLKLFPFSLRDKARQWLMSLPTWSIGTWEEMTERFYNGLNGQSRTIVDSTAGGSLMAKSIPEAYNLLKEMSTNSYQWSSERSIPKKTAGIHEVGLLISLSAQVSALSNQIVALTNKEESFSREAVAGASTLFAQDEYTQEQVQFVNNRNFNYRPNQLPNRYHPGLRNHENFSYANNRNVLQPLLGFNQQVVEKKPFVEDLLSTFIVETRGRFNKDEARLDNIETHCNNMNATMKSLEVQIGQLANAVKGQSSGKFPSDTEPNPKDHCKAITLRSEEEVEAPKPQEDKIKEEEVGSEQPKESVRPKSISFLDNPPLIALTLPYP
ncbi:uncharacterized protein LOC112091203 [Morus notabilis]|uniref:uncharacterized protein LOC112091203 n=1 Tax=Morus notabilis TaxID=981085 RepID=UPI000CED0A5C|nr:uncharacterized protein LOC112091203 [Morus notabilis]